MTELQQRIYLLFSIPIYAVLIPIEIFLSNFSHLRFYTWKETAVNIYLNLLNAGIDMLLRLVVGLTFLTFFYQHSLPIQWHPVVYWVVLLLGEDLLFWLEHFVDHRCRLFWAVHVTHHSSQEYNLSTGFRSSVLMPVYKYLYFIPLAVLGFRPADILFMFSITQIYGILVHTQYIKKLPAWIEYIFVTPSHHRVHHASNIPYLDKNMGMVFIIWDRLFGTFAPELPHEKPHYGITKPIDTPYHPLHIVTHEWQALARDLRRPMPILTKVRYMLNPPGWSHDGSTKTSKQLQQELEANNNN
ncbi:sterol desaturase family protein [Nemorincola caseinilytica]|uniref:Sterol desaturase family protein n=1 Tax=Nemorincola caseinilytica TaxID=2054315 RepID=A0ABP8NKS4_9BACT